MTVKNQEYPGTHEAIISEQTFYKCQKYIKNGNKGDNISAGRINETFPLRHFILCPHCERPLTACMSKSKSGKKYPFYKCYNKNCSGLKSISKDKLEGEFIDYLKKITPSREYLDSFRKVMLDVFKEKQGSREKDFKTAQIELARLQQEKAKLIEMKKKDLLDDDDFKEEMEKVKQNINDKQAIMYDQPEYNRNIFKEAEKVFKVIANLSATYRDANYHEKLKLQSLIFTEKPTFDFTGNQTPKISLILQTKRELAHANSPIVVPRGIEPLFPG
ncbi:hypothetical protein EOL94_00275 [bacterium]|nr:hypothetical protein [bacterium]